MANGAEEEEELQNGNFDSKDAEEEAEEIRDELGAEIGQVYASSAEELEGEIAAAQDEIEEMTFEPVEIDAASTTPPNDSLEDTSSETGRAELEARIAKLERRLARLNRSTHAAKESNAAKFLREVGVGVTSGTALIVVEEIIRRAAGRKDHDVRLSDRTKEHIQALVDGWQRLDDDALWQRMADDVEKHRSDRTYSLADVLLFLQYTARMNPLKETFLWDSYEDQNELVDVLTEAYAQSGQDVSAVIRRLPALRYRSAAVPRYIAAKLGAIAVSWVM